MNFLKNLDVKKIKKKYIKMSNNIKKKNFPYNFICFDCCEENNSIKLNSKVTESQFSSLEIINKEIPFSNIGGNNFNFLKKQKKKISLIEFPKGKLFFLKNLENSNGILVKITTHDLANPKISNLKYLIIKYFFFYITKKK